jgi:hypothetical protein
VNLKVAVRVAALREAYAEVEKTIEQWSNGSLAKYHTVESLRNARDVLEKAIASGDDDTIMRLPVPIVVHTNVIWNVHSKQDAAA